MEKSQSLFELSERAARAARAVDEIRVRGEFTAGAVRLFELLVDLQAAAEWVGTFGHVLAHTGRLGYCVPHRCVFSTASCLACAPRGAVAR